ncbi:MAG: hypothetical protein K0S46_537 [Moraxellaceae bacterium]|jgi:hypothetical protein|nr:hypothetical protein [Moraxellaceae bacterium]
MRSYDIATDAGNFKGFGACPKYERAGGASTRGVGGVPLLNRIFIATDIKKR